MSLQPPGWSSRESCTYSTHNNCSFVYKNYKIKTYTVLHIHTNKYTSHSSTKITKSKLKTHTVHHTNCLQRFSIYHYLSIKHVSLQLSSRLYMILLLRNDPITCCDYIVNNTDIIYFAEICSNAICTCIAW